MDHAAHPSVRKRLSKWQTITLVTLITGYAGYYVCRSNLSVVTVLILKEFASQGMTKVHIGQITTLGVFLYAIGKITHGILAELLEDDFFSSRNGPFRRVPDFVWHGYWIPPLLCSLGT